MAYLEKYYISFCTKDGRPAKVSILQKDYEGSSTEFIGQPIPVTINYDSDEDFKFSPVRASSCDINMVFDENLSFEAIWTADEREFKVEVTIEGNLEWTGYIIPNGFQYSFTGGKYYATATASDGLGTLADYAFFDTNTNKPYGNSNLTYNDGFKFPFSLIATEILRKLDLDLDLWNCINSYEQSMVKTGNTRDADPLSAAFVDVRTYIKESDEKDKPYWALKGEEWNCLEVMENLLNIFGAKLYQEHGTWRIKSVDADVNYGTGATQLYWRKYNTLCVYLGQEIINDVHSIPCNDKGAYLLGNNHTMSMDYVYGAFRMNYEYTFLREGDTPLNLVPNGNFDTFVNTSKLDAPEGWYRWRRDNKWYIRLQQVEVTPPSDTNGIPFAIEIGTQKTGIDASGTDPNPAIWTGLMTEKQMFVFQGGKLTMSIWNKFRYNSPDKRVQYAPMYRLVLNTLGSVGYYLRNNFIDGKHTYTWEKTEANQVTDPFGNIYGVNLNNYFFYFNAWDSSNNSDLDSYVWHNFIYNLPDMPENGWLSLSIHGLAASSGRNSDNFPAFKSWTTSTTFWNPIPTANYELTDKWRVVRENWVDEGGDIPRLQITGINIGIIPAKENYAPAQDYVYENQNPRYTYETDPITVYNGDVQEDIHISNILVPTNETGKKNFWNTLNNEFDLSSIGLLTVRQIMRQYFKPYRILEGSVKIDNATFGGVYEIPTLEGLRFILQRASFDVKNQIISEGTFVQISGEILPEGGTEGGLGTGAMFRPTGITYCQKEDGLNTGYVIVEEQDVNQNSELFGDFRDVVLPNPDTDTCPIGAPWSYYFGVDDISMEIANINTYPIDIVSPNEIQVSYNNDGVKYLYLVHLASLGVVERIYTMTQPNNVISDWVYLSDITINGYLYRVLRTDYTMIEFSDYPHNFVFSE